MFTTPIAYKPLKDLNELKKFSFMTTEKTKHTMTFTQNNGEIAFSDSFGNVYVTPYRPEVSKILTSSGFTDSYSLHVPFSNGEHCEPRPDRYRWLARIADEECMAYTYELAHDIAINQKKIKPVTVNQKIHVKEIKEYCSIDNYIFHPLCIMFLQNASKDNIGTYICINEKTVLVCDEYGRSFLITSKTIINDLVNSLIDAGYTRTAYPEFYVTEKKSD